MTPEELIESAILGMNQAYAPYSNYRVGSAVWTESGQVFTGCNVENASYGLTNCAERTALFSMVAAGDQSIRAVAVVADGEQEPLPCGACRQVLAEFGRPDTPVYVARAADPTAYRTFTLGELLPHSFKL